MIRGKGIYLSYINLKGYFKCFDIQQKILPLGQQSMYNIQFVENNYRNKGFGHQMGSTGYCTLKTFHCKFL